MWIWTTARASSTSWRQTNIVLCDVNVFVYAHRRDAARHEQYLAWLEQRLASDEAFGVSDLVLSGFLSVVTHPRVFRSPTPMKDALDFVGAICQQPNMVAVSAGPRHWGIFERLCTTAGAKGNLVADAYLAALAIESGAEWVTTDRDYARFRDLRWRHPLEDRG